MSTLTGSVCIAEKVRRMDFKSSKEADSAARAASCGSIISRASNNPTKDTLLPLCSAI